MWPHVAPAPWGHGDTASVASSQGLKRQDDINGPPGGRRLSTRHIPAIYVMKTKDFHSIGCPCPSSSLHCAVSDTDIVSDTAYSRASEFSLKQ